MKAARTGMRLALALAAGSGGCGRTLTFSTGDFCSVTSELNGITYEVAGESGCSSSTTDDGAIFKVGSHVLRVRKGRLSLDGADRGTVKSGDHVRLTDDGTLTVNGAKRHPR